MGIIVVVTAAAAAAFVVGGSFIRDTKKNTHRGHSCELAKENQSFFRNTRQNCITLYCTKHLHSAFPYGYLPRLWLIGSPPI